MGRHRISVVLSALLIIAGLEGFGVPARADPIRHVWAMNEPKGTGRMFDTGPATKTNGRWKNIRAGVAGVKHTAYFFNGVNARVIVSDNSSLDPGASRFTVTAWVKFTTMPTKANGGDYDLVRKGVGSSAGGYWKMEIFPANRGTKAVGTCQMKGSVTGAKIKEAPYSLNDGTWHRISCTKTDDAIRLTVDGQTYTKTVTIGSIASSAPLTVGAKPGSGGDWYKGTMDQVRLRIGT